MQRLKGYDALIEAVRSVSLPAAPPRTSIEGAAVGLSFLDTVLRLNHVRRITDRLTVVEHRSAQRTTEVDVDLGMLDENQRQAAMLFQHLVSQGQQGVTDRAATVWVPVARISRRSVTPVDVLNASGQKLPRLTQYETSRLLASALFHLLRGILASDPQARKNGTPLNRLLFKEHEARWLIQAGLQTLLTDRNHPQSETSASRPSGPQAKARALALEVLREHKALLADYRSLLDIAVNDYLLVVALDSRTDEHLLTYDAPLRVTGPRRQALSLPAKLRANSRGYLAEYQSTIPAGLRSYHLVVETEAGVDIERMYLSTDADQVLVDELATDLDTLADRLRTAQETPEERSSVRLLELAADTTLRQVAELLRRKRWDADQAEFTLDEEGLHEAARLGRAAVNGEIVSDSNGQNGRPITSRGTVTVESLRSAAGQLRRAEAGLDLALENDPVRSRAHAYWRRHAGRLPDGAPQTTVKAGLVLRDTTAAGPISVFCYAVGIGAIAYLMAFLLTGRAFPFDSSTAADFGRIDNTASVITVLLLIPGFLYTRLALPDKHSISGYLRALPRLVAQLCVGSMAVVAAAIAAGSPGWIVELLFSIAVVLPWSTSLVTVYPTMAGWLRRRQDKTKRTLEQELWLIGAPAWVHGGALPNGRRWPADAVFQSTGAES
ncbi:hypothetical protein AB0C38_13490 [Amycolatopsis sp. NPDC048633]|uniref:hypothetical protein n=1 Tax=Amycolatopsis sp. NPDC048633 TaxID=3157095 RepID=UPI0033FD163F